MLKFCFGHLGGEISYSLVHFEQYYSHQWLQIHIEEVKKFQYITVLCFNISLSKFQYITDCNILWDREGIKFECFDFLGFSHLRIVFK